MLTDTEKAALAEELAEALWDLATYEKRAATACLPIIERVIAERDLDALLDSVPGAFIEFDWARGDQRVIIIHLPDPNDGGYYPEVYTYRGIGPTRIAAVQAAVKAAKEAQNHE